MLLYIFFRQAAFQENVGRQVSIYRSLHYDAKTLFKQSLDKIKLKFC